MKNIFLLLIALFLVGACGKKAELPDYGKVSIPGSYMNQLGETVDSTDFKGKVVVADFVFTHCPSICIPMAGQMKRVQDEYLTKDDVRLLSFSIDPERDTLERLQWYTDKVGVESDRWWFLRSDMETIKKAAKECKVFQEADAEAPGGFNHQSWFVLIDKNGHMRGSYDGTDPVEVDKLKKHMKLLF